MKKEIIELPLPKKDNIFYSTYHTLFLKDIIPDPTPHGDDGLFHIHEPYTLYDLYLGTFMEKESKLHELFHELRQSNINDFLDIRIYSYGGSVDEGKQLENIINEYFPNRTRTILDPLGHSMGALTFCMGDERLIYGNSTLMFHDYSHRVDGKGGEIDSQVKHNSQQMRDFSYSIMVPKGFLSSDEFEDMIIGKDFWMDALEMCVRGIATHIMISSIKVLAKHYVLYVDEEITYEEMMTGKLNEKPKKKAKKKKAKKVNKDTK